MDGAGKLRSRRFGAAMVVRTRLAIGTVTFFRPAANRFFV